MKTIKTIAFAFALFISATLASVAQGHSHKPPHRGTLHEVGGYHIEMVSASGIVNFYVMDASNSLLADKTLSGDVIFENANKTKNTAILLKYYLKKASKSESI